MVFENYLQILCFVEVEPLVSKSRREVTCTTGADGENFQHSHSKVFLSQFAVSQQTCTLARCRVFGRSYVACRQMASAAGAWQRSFLVTRWMCFVSSSARGRASSVSANCSFCPHMGALCHSGWGATLSVRSFVTEFLKGCLDVSWHD